MFRLIRPTDDIEETFKIVDEYDKRAEFNQFHNYPKLIIYKDNLYFAMAGNADHVKYYEVDDSLYEMSVNITMQCAGLVKHSEGNTDDIVFLQNEEYENQDIDFAEAGDKEIFNYLLQWEN